MVRLPATQRTFAAAAPPGVYYVRVVAINAAGTSPPSNEVVVSIDVGATCLAPDPPTLSALGNAMGVMMVFQSALTGGAPTSYILDAGSSAGVSNLGSFPLPVTTVYTASAPPGAYFLRLRAVNACGTSASSAEIAVTVGGGPAPVFVSAGRYIGMTFDTLHVSQGTAPRGLFVLTLDSPVMSPTPVPITGSYADGNGCVRDTGILAGGVSGGVRIIVPALPCLAGDLILTITSSLGGSIFEGTCNDGLNCTFRLTRAPF